MKEKDFYREPFIQPKQRWYYKLLNWLKKLLNWLKKL
jgi:hypothetical protein